MRQIISDVNGRVTEIRAQGVVEISPSVLNCNQENLLETANKLVNEINPERDWYGKFAANIIITIELTGELEEKDG